MEESNPLKFCAYDMKGMTIIECKADGKKLRNDRDAIELIGEALQRRADLMIVPVEHFEDDFFQLKTRIAGDILQKFVAYGVRLAIAGDISRYSVESSALRDFVYESNRGDHVWFLANLEELDRRMERSAS